MLFKIVDRLMTTIAIILAFLAIQAVLNDVIASPIVYINEIHYDNTGGDQNEFVELAGEAGTNLMGWSLSFYNGSNGTLYKTLVLGDLLLIDQNNGLDFVAFNIAGIQNGAPDGLVLADENQNVIQFLSYEGSFMATNGIASGITSDDIGIFESSSTPLNFSLQLAGIGSFDDFIWQSPQQSTFGQINTSQQIIPVNSTVSVSEPKALSLLILALFIIYTQQILFSGPPRLKKTYIM